MRVFLLAASLVALTPSGVSAAEPAFLAVIDPGHGGERSGAQGADGTTEKALALQIAKKLAARISRQGGRAILTRNRDMGVPLAARAALANAQGADFFISIHLNSMPEGTRRRFEGVETYFLSADATDESAFAVAARENADRLAGEPGPDADNPVAGILEDLGRSEALAASSKLAYEIHERVVAATGAPDRGVKQAPFYVLAGARMAAVLVEVGFLTHPAEGRRLATPAYQDKVAAAIADGIARWRAASPLPVR